jgi:hypothetical protein
LCASQFKATILRPSNEVFTKCYLQCKARVEADEKLENDELQMPFSSPSESNDDDDDDTSSN